jgi:hypothetical protein
MEHVVEKVGVLIEGFRSHEDDQISDKVPGKEEDQDNSGDGDDELFPDGGGPVSFEAAGKSVHGVKKEGRLRRSREE